MAEPTSVALAAAPIPSSAEISRAEKLVRERFLHEGEDPAVALAPGTPRRRALDEALAELEADPKAKHPSTAWRREFSLLLGLERLLSEDEPKLADGTVLSAHQVDALSGTLTALLAEAQRARQRQRRAPRRPRPSCSPRPRSSAPTTPSSQRRRRRRRPRTRRRGAEDEDDEDERRGGRGGRRGRRRRARAGAARGARRGRDEDDLDERRRRAEPDEDEDDEAEEEPEAEADEEPRDWVEEGEDEEESLGRAARGPQRRQALLVRARHRRRQDGRRARLRRGLADRRRADPHPPAQPRRPVQRRAARPWLRQAHQPPAAEGRGLRQRARDRRDLPVVRAQRRQDLERLHDRDLRRGAHRARREDERRRSATGPGRSSSA